MESTTISQRLIQYIQHIGVGIDSFSRNCGLSSRSLLNLQSTQRYLLHKITEAYPTLNKRWLETGVGEMICTPPHYPRSIEIESLSEVNTTSPTIKPIEQKHDDKKQKAILNETAIRDRLLLYINYIGTSVKDFAMSCSLTESSIHTIDKKTTTQTLNKIYSAFPRLNPVWLQKGEGKMERLTDAVESHLYERIKEENERLIQSIQSKNEEVFRLIKLLEERDKTIAKLIEKL